MNWPHESLGGQVQALLDRVERSTVERCDALRKEADQQVRQILQEGHQQARAQVHNAVTQERARLAQGLQRTQAQVQLEQRQQKQAQERERLKGMWAQLPDLLAARWQEAQPRRMWCEAAVQEAGRLLSGRAWTVEVDPHFPQDERTSLEALAREKGATSVKWVEVPSLGPGLRVRTDGVCMAATIPGLLARPADVESAFLACYERPEHAEPESR